MPVTAPGFDPGTVLADFIERYKARFDIELPEMTAMLVNLRTTVIGRRAPVDLAIFAPAIDGSGAPQPSGARQVRFTGGWFDTRDLRPGFPWERGDARRSCDRRTARHDGRHRSRRDGRRRRPGQSGDFGRCGMTLDPVTLAVIQNGLRQVASEMDLVHEKTSFSPVISEGFDRSNGIYDRTTGEVVAQGELGLPIFVGVMQFTTQAVIERRRDLEPGDVILVNDPYLGGTHLMDVKMVRPFYYRGRLWCYLSNTGHWPDTGGMVPGGFSATATEIVQEGLRLPPVKLVRRGEICQDIIDIVLNNIRVADERIGDIRAQLGALSVGERRLTQLLDRYGVETVDAAIAELKAGSERLMRAHIDSIPDGTYSATAIVDSDGIVDQAARSGAGHDGFRLRHPFRSVAVEPAVPRPDELGMGDDAIGGLCRDEAHFPRRADQCRLFRADPHCPAGRHLSLCPLSAPGRRLRCRGGAAHHGGGVRRDGDRRSRSVSLRRRPAPAAISA